MTAIVSPPSAPASVAESTFRVMGTDAHIVVVDGPPGAIDAAHARLDELEARWSRFRPDSELCRVNDRSGSPVAVSAITFDLLERACLWWHRTHGAFDPTVLPALERAGYDRSFERIEPTDGNGRSPVGEPAPGCAHLTLDPVVRAVTVPAGVRLDLGGIAKGYAADLITEELLHSGAAGACVNLGGDLRVGGRPPAGATAWVVALDAPPGLEQGQDQPRMLALADGAIATTSRALRTWRRGTSVEHHVIDPRTGRPARTSWISATVVAGRAVVAEPLAKAALLAATPAAASTLLAEHGATGVLVGDDGALHPLVGVDGYLLDPDD